MANQQISAQEQLLIELVNRARLDPQGEAVRYGIGLNDGLAAGTISSAPKAPLAWNADLGEAAALHSEWMLATDTFSHTGVNGTNAGARMTNAGYQFTGSWGWGENISWRGTTGTLDATATIIDQHMRLFLSSGHRANMMGNFREIGVGQEIGSFTSNGTTYNASMVTENFARAGTRAFITGVAYQDKDGDGFYDVGEGMGGVTFDWRGDTGNAAATQAAGGYGVAIPTGLTGTAGVAVTSGGVTMDVTLSMTGNNVKLDLMNGNTLAASAHLILGQNAPNGRLLGAGDLNLTGNGLNNRIEGNAGANAMNGAGGADTILGNNGNDRIEGGAGDDILTGGAGADSFVFTIQTGAATGQDRIADLGSGDRIVVDLIGTLPSEAAWEDAHIVATASGWAISLDNGSSILVAGGNLSLVESALTLI